MRGSATSDREKHLCARASVLCSGDRTVLWRGTDRRQMRAAQELYTFCLYTNVPARMGTRTCALGKRTASRVVRQEDGLKENKSAQRLTQRAKGARR